MTLRAELPVQRKRTFLVMAEQLPYKHHQRMNREHWKATHERVT